MLYILSITYETFQMIILIMRYRRINCIEILNSN